MQKIAGASLALYPSFRRTAQRIRQGGIACLLFGAAIGAAAQSAEEKTGGSSKKAGSDQDWSSLQTWVLAGDSRLDPAAETASREVTRARQASEFLVLAEQARKFRTDYPEDARSKAAGVMEARNLLKAALVGDQSQLERAFSIADTLKADLTIDEVDRFGVAFLEQQVLVRPLTASPQEFLAASAAAARRLMAGYPDQSGGYEWLLATAEGMQDDEQLARAAKEILDLNAPFRAKARATIVTERFSLVGKSLANFANTALGRDNFFEQSRTRRTVLYTWDARDPGSIAWATDLERQLPSDVLAIGVCLSTDIATAKEVAESMKLSPWQYFSEAGPGSFLALRLKLNTPGQIYVTDANDTVITVTAREDNVVSFLGK